ncbi:MAG: GLUG motif-containing protein [Thermoplasmata archaeon]
MYAAGLIGHNNRGIVKTSFALGNITGNDYVGGLVGNNYDGTVTDSYATGAIYGNQWVGGLVGYNNGGTVERAYATGNIMGSEWVGGFVGNNSEGVVKNSYSRGHVIRISGYSSSDIGGFVGDNYQGKVINCYSTGSVEVKDGELLTANGFAGSVDSGGSYEMCGNFWDVETSGQTSTTGNSTGKTTVEMKTQSTFTDASWDFNNIWHMVENVTYPLLQWQELPEFDSMVLDLYAYAESDGWNFISFNLALVDTSLTSILADIDGSYDRGMYYDASTDKWQSYVPGRPEHFNDLDTWNHHMGIWIRVTNSTTLTLEGYVTTSTDITLYPGWNMVGYPSSGNSVEGGGLPLEVTKIGYFDDMADYNLAYDYETSDFIFEPGNGYWLYNGADYAVTWTVEY